MGHSISPPRARQDVYSIITDRVIALMEQGTIPWRKPWRGGAAGIPQNAVSQKPYRGVNIFMLAVTSEMMGFQSRYWLTYKQAQQLGGNVRQGEKSTPVIFWKWLDVEDTDDAGQKQAREIPMLRYYSVFNADQCEGLSIPAEAQNTGDTLDFEPIGACENILDHMPNKPEIVHSPQARAYYRPSADQVHIPPKHTFISEQEYYSTLFHELVHSTGHESRLNRRKDAKNAAFGSNDYSKEELVAEMGAAFLCGYAEIETATIENSAAYIRGWLSQLRSDKRLVVTAAAQAQKAADYILGE